MEQETARVGRKVRGDDGAVKKQVVEQVVSGSLVSPPSPSPPPPNPPCSRHEDSPFRETEDATGEGKLGGGKNGKNGGAPEPHFNDDFQWTPDDTLPGEADFQGAWKVVLERWGGAARVKKEGLLNQLAEEVFESFCRCPRFQGRLGLFGEDPMRPYPEYWRRRFMPGIMKAAPVGAASAR